MTKEYLKILDACNIDANCQDVIDIKEMLQDQGVYLNVFIWFYAMGEVPFLELQQLYFKIKTFRELLRQYKITPLDVYKPKLYEAKSQYELLLDFIDGAISENQKENFARSFISKKYIHLINRNSQQILWKLHDELRLDRKNIQSLIFDKLAGYKFAEEFEKAIQKTFNMLTQGTWNVEYLKMELNQELIDVVFYDDDVLIARLDSYEQCKAVGSRNWCITRSRSMFDMYTKNGTQYIIYNTTKNRTHGDAIVGYTAKANSDNKISFLGVSYNQFDKPYDWKKGLHKYLKHMPCVKEIDFLPDNINEKVFASLNKNVGIDETVIQKLDDDSLKQVDFKKLASYQKNALLYGAIILNKEKCVDELLKDKNININSTAIANFSISPNNMLAVALKIKNYETVEKIFKHKSCNQETLNSNYVEMLRFKNPDKTALNLLTKQYKTDEQLESVIFNFLKTYSSWTWRRYNGDTHGFERFLQIHKPSQTLILNYLNKTKDHFYYNEILILFQNFGYVKHLPLKHRKNK